MSTTERANRRSLDASELAARIGLWSIGNGPLYHQLTGAVAQLVQTGELRDGDRLPPERALATRLSVSRGTIVAAYDALRDAGVVTRVQGRGTTVRTDAAEAHTAGERPIGDELFHSTGTTIDLLMAVPEILPEVLDLLRTVDLDADHRILGSSDPAGIPELRQAIAERITRDGLPSTSEQIVVTAGAQQAIVLVTAMLARPDDIVLTEETTWPGLADTARRVGARVIGVPMDQHGIIIDELATLIDRFRPAFIGLNPHHHNPTGACLPPARREAVAKLAADYRVPLVEDRVAAPLTFGGLVPPPLAVHQPGAVSIVIDSINKSAWPGLRIGWIRANVAAVNDLRSSRALADLFSPIPSQLMAIAVLDHLDMIHRVRIAQLASRAAVLQTEVAHQLPDWTLSPLRGGMVAWAKLPHGSATHLARLAAGHGVSVASGRAFASNTDFDDHIRLPFTAPEADLRNAIIRLARAWAELPRSGPARDTTVAAIV